jgi:hypothetical protein
LLGLVWLEHGVEGWGVRMLAGGGWGTAAVRWGGRRSCGWEREMAAL